MREARERKPAAKAGKGNKVKEEKEGRASHMPDTQYNTFTDSQEHQRSKMNSSHKPSFIALVIVNVIVVVIVFAFNGLSAAGQPPYVSTTSNQSAKFNLEITPAGWTFSIWGVIYFWQVLWILYSIVNLFRSTAQGPAYLNPTILPASLFIFYTLGNFGNIAWLLLFDRDHIEAAFVALLLITIFVVLCLVVTYRSLDWGTSLLLEQGRRVDVWLVRGLVHNGLGIYGTWVSIATLLNLAMVITYSGSSSVSVSTASTIALAVLSVELVTFVLTDLILLDRYSRYTLTPYGVFIVALAGSISKNWQAGATNSVFSAVLIAVACLAAVVKIAVTIYRHLTRSAYSTDVTPTFGDGKGQRA